MISHHLSHAFLLVFGLTGHVHASSILFTGGTVIAFNEVTNDLDVIRNGTLLINNDRIAGLWQSGETPVVPVPSDAEVVDATGKILSPGFVDTHRHGWQTLYKTMVSNATISEYFGRFGEYATAGRLDAEQVYISQLAGLYEGLNAGTTTSLDHAHHTWSDDTSYAGLNASLDSGARVFWAYAFHEVTNYTISQQLVNLRNIANEVSFENTTVSLGVACDLFDTVSLGGSADPAMVTAVFDLAKELNVSVLTTHSSGGPYGLDNTPTALHAQNMLNTSIPVVFSHATHIAYEDAMLLRSTNQHISITPETEMALAIGFPHSAWVMDQASLGIDSHGMVSSDLVTQARIWLQTARLRINDKLLDDWIIPSSTPMSVVQAFLLATRNGGLALRRPDLGVLSVGAKADVIVWDGTSPAMLGWIDPVAAIVLHSNVGDIEHVVVDGRFVKRGFKLVAQNYDDVKLRFLAATKRVHDDWRAFPYPERQEFFSTGARFQDPVQVDVVAGDGTGYGQLYL